MRFWLLVNIMSHHHYTRPPFKVIAHRGNSSQAPENTLEAFRQAITIPVDFLECDIQLSKDNTPVVIHDSTFHRITGAKSKEEVDQLNFDQIKTIDAGSWFDEKYHNERISTLEEFLTLPKNKIGMMIEIKAETVTECGLAKIVGDVIKKTHVSSQVLIGSLNPDILLCLEGYLPEQQFIPIVDHWSKYKKFREIPAKHYALYDPLATKKRIAELHERGCEVWAWTVNDKQRALKLMDRGIDGIITNMPKKMMSIHCAPHH